jgi:dehydrogenase/reductase SDR family member 7B
MAIGDYAHTMKNKNIVITGGSSGIGKALATVFGKNGSRILITGRNAAELEATVAELRAQGITISGYRAHVSREEDNNAMAEDAIRL